MPTTLKISNRALAERVLRLHERHGAELNRNLADLQTELPAEEFEAYRSAVAQVMGRAFISVLDPLYQQYPDLQPDELKESDKP